MESYRQFIIHCNKIPTDYRTGRPANAHDSAIWTDAETARAAAMLYGDSYGIGFVFTEADPFWFLDIDKCLENNEWSPLAQQLAGRLSGAYIEVSMSGRGLHIIGSGTVPTHGCKNIGLKLELYTAGRFVALTGTYATGDAKFDLTTAISSVVAEYFPIGSGNITNGGEWTTEPRSDWNGHTDDVSLISHAMASRSVANAFGSERASFADLYTADNAALARAYPCGQGRPFDASSADAALASHLAFWTGNNCERIERLMRGSRLLREKWDLRADYLPRTISGACGKNQKVHIKSIEITTTATDGQPLGKRTEGLRFSNAEDQIKHFRGCVYVVDEHKAFIPGGFLLAPERFKVCYGGYNFQLDNSNAKMIRNAWEVFTESQCVDFPRADSSCFKPNQPQGQILSTEGQQLLNTYWEIPIERKEGDVTPFLLHIAKLCPDRNDQKILISYLAAVVQHKGVKFQWCPLIQGMEGNGKTLLTRCVARAIGNRYTHFPKAAEIASKFNDWIDRKIFIGIEDIYVPDGRKEMMEAMKPLITAERQEIEAKGGDKITKDVCANFIINTNHLDGLRKTRNDRRFAPFFTAQQTLADLKRDGMDSNYFSQLYGWLDKGGYAIVSYYLNTCVIEDQYNPAVGSKRAPITTSTEIAIEHGSDRIEQIIKERIEMGVYGFKDGWISSAMLDNLLKDIKADGRFPPNKRRELLMPLNYEMHPNLPEGRTSAIAREGGRTRLYIHKDNPAVRIKGTREIMQAYVKAQESS